MVFANHGLSPKHSNLRNGSLSGASLALCAKGTPLSELGSLRKRTTGVRHRRNRAVEIAVRGAP